MTQDFVFPRRLQATMGVHGAESLNSPGTSQNQIAKAAVWNWWEQIQLGSEPARQACERWLAPDVKLHAHEPVGTSHGIVGFLRDHWRPLLTAFQDLQRVTHVYIGGLSCGRRDGRGDLDGAQWVGGTGVFNGRFIRPYLGLQPTGQSVSIRWGEFCRWSGGRVDQVYLLLDLVDFFQQIGLQVLPQAAGVDGLWPAPHKGDGVLLQEQDDAQSDFSLEHIWRFIYQGLNRFDQQDLRSMGMADWFSPRVHWFGPGGIGACLDFEAFETRHQRPWLRAFPDRSVQDLTALIAEGAFSGGPGWAGVLARHSGPYLGCEPTGREVAINGIDFWKREGDRYIENWVFVDMLHLFGQFGVDLMARARSLGQTIGDSKLR